MPGIHGCGRPGIAWSAGAGNHPEEGRALVAGLTRRYRPCDRGVAGGAQSRCRDAGGPDVEAAGTDVAGPVTSGAAAIKVSSGNMCVWSADDHHIREGSRDRRRMTTEAVGHSYVGARYGIQRIVVRSRVALRARRARGNVVGWTQGVVRERSRGTVTFAAVTRARMR